MHCHSQNKIGAVQTRSPVLYGCRNMLVSVPLQNIYELLLPIARYRRFFQTLSLAIRPETSRITIARRRRENFEYLSFEIRSKATVFEGLDDARNAPKHLKTLFLARRRRIFFGSPIELIRKPPLVCSQSETRGRAFF